MPTGDSGNKEWLLQMLLDTMKDACSKKDKMVEEHDRAISVMQTKMKIIIWFASASGLAIIGMLADKARQLLSGL